LSTFTVTKISEAESNFYTGSWVQLEPDETLGIPTGVPIQNYSLEAGRSWRTSKHGFSPSVNHQIHCLVSFPSEICFGTDILTLNRRDGSNTT